MKNVLLGLLVFAAISLQAQPVEVKSEIKEVTVFIKGAQINRSFDVGLKKGQQEIKLVGLSPYVDPKTIQIKGSGNFTILSIRHQLNFIKQGELDDEIKEIFDSLNFYKSQYGVLTDEMDVLLQSESFLISNRSVKGQEQLDVSGLAAAHDYFIKQLTLIKKRRSEIEAAKKLLSKSMDRFRNQLNEINKKLATSSSEVFVELSSDEARKGEFQVSYLVGNAGWYPSYDVRVSDINSPINLNYKANVQQSTGVDWKNVKLTFSNADPYASSDLPNLVPYRLNYVSGVYRSNGYQSQENSYDLRNYVSTTAQSVRGRVIGQDGAGIPYANVLVVGTSIGTTTDDLGYFDVTLPAGQTQIMVSQNGFDDVVQNVNLSGFNNVTLVSNKPVLTDSDGDGVSDFFDVESYSSSIQNSANIQRMPSRGINSVAATRSSKGFSNGEVINTLTMENVTSISIAVETPYSIESGGKMRTIRIKNIDIPAYYEYRAVPKLREAAYLIARVADWGGYNLMEGEASLYFENTYIGKSILDVRFLTDTLNISLGQDKGVIIAREKVKSSTSREFIGGDQIEKRQFEIKVKNNKGQKINLIVYDQIPISARPKDIEVTVRDINGAIYNETTGELKWELNMDPGTETSMVFKYQVKFPKKQQINLE